jgi:hypothetical protein
MTAFAEVKQYLDRLQSLPGQMSSEDFPFSMAFRQLSLDQQIVLLKEFAARTNDGRAWKMLGYCYFWTGKDAFLPDAIQSLTRSLDAGFDGTKDAVCEAIGICQAYLGNEALSKQWILKSSRLDLEHVMASYGSIRRLGDSLRFGNDGTRYQGTEQGGYSENQLHLECCTGQTHKPSFLRRLFGR